MKKRIESRSRQKLEMFICFAFAFLDMIFLKDVIRQMRPGISGSMAGLIAFAIAIIADYMALDWGKKKGKRESARSSFIMWVFLGIVYLFLRCSSFYFDIIAPGNYSFNAIAYQIFAIGYLTASYLITGLVLRHQASKYWDIDITNYLESKEKFDAENKKNAQNEAILSKMIETLEDYDENYVSLDKKYQVISDTIRKEEKSIMAQITSKVLKKHQDVDPDDADDVMQKILHERDIENEKSHR